MESFVENTTIRYTVPGSSPSFARVTTIDAEDNYIVLKNEDGSIHESLKDFVSHCWNSRRLRVPRKLDIFSDCYFYKSGQWWQCLEMLPPPRLHITETANRSSDDADTSSDYVPESDNESEHDSDFDDLASEHTDEDEVEEPEDDVLTDGDYEEPTGRFVHPRRRTRQRPLEQRPLDIATASAAANLLALSRAFTPTSTPTKNTSAVSLPEMQPARRSARIAAAKS
jgi:hypothetical protein